MRYINKKYAYMVIETNEMTIYRMALLRGFSKKPLIRVICQMSQIFITKIIFKLYNIIIISDNGHCVSIRF